ncbi:Uncharacterised protein [Mycobacterium tuberculosis]|uniref:Uncharacterized protein n=1 Tax=Mycobacterium tuberculosis TaxID=1773 RepID=A0A0U0T9Q3_MYCTX|nr:Uncharacterised protein [Mycobacterium tuberculosis]CNV34892.1 Uncharacterised protein [Mycobacterium tuberculosis]CNV49646.1 Uncharacterised protein [Mycobacterium tuberculosis]CNV73100.1 Uncharacterised protein [Mycobacterium tuberculosis]COW84865.1 Uncharacterised protein [Mycobacterium tuberculosis]
MVDHAIDEGDHSAETRCQPTRLEMPADIVGQLLWAEPSEFVDTHLIGPDDPAFGKALEQPENAEIFVADHMCDNFFDAPPGAQAGCFPLLQCEGSQKRR